MPNPDSQAAKPYILLTIGRWLLVGVVLLGILLIATWAYLSQRNSRFTARLREVSPVTVSSSVGATAAPPRDVAASAPKTTPQVDLDAPALESESFDALAAELRKHLSLSTTSSIVRIAGAEEPILSQFSRAVVYPQGFDKTDPGKVNRALELGVRAGFAGLNYWNNGRSDNPIFHSKLLSSPSEFHAFLDRARAAVIAELLTEEFMQADRANRNFRLHNQALEKWALWEVVLLRSVIEGDVEFLNRVALGDAVSLGRDTNELDTARLLEDRPYVIVYDILNLASKTDETDTYHWAIQKLEAIRISPEMERRQRHAVLLRLTDRLITTPAASPIGPSRHDPRLFFLDGTPQRIINGMVRPAFERELEAFTLDLIDGRPDPDRARELRIYSLCGLMLVDPPNLNRFRSIVENSNQVSRRLCVIQGKLLLAMRRHLHLSGDLEALRTAMFAELTDEESDEASSFGFRLYSVPSGFVFAIPDALPPELSPPVRRQLNDKSVLREMHSPEDLDSLNPNPAERDLLSSYFVHTEPAVVLLHTMPNDEQPDQEILMWGGWGSPRFGRGSEIPLEVLKR